MRVYFNLEFSVLILVKCGPGIQPGRVFYCFVHCHPKKIIFDAACLPFVYLTFCFGFGLGFLPVFWFEISEKTEEVERSR